MNLKMYKDDRGFSIIIIAVVVVVLMGALGYGAYRALNKDQTSDSLGGGAASIPCDTDDKDVCKFLSSWKANKQYRMTSTGADGTKSVFEIDGEKTHAKMEMNGTPYETITIGKVTYTKSGETWYKQTAKDTDNEVEDQKVEFKEPAKEDGETEEAKNTTTYKKLGKEKCGKLMCFKYEVLDSSAPDQKQTIWFDDKDYQLRKTSDGTTETTFEYEGVSIKAPSPVKELGENQYIIPGQSEPATIPSVE